MTDTTEHQAVTVAHEARRVALIERIGTIADQACSTPLDGELGDVAYDLLRQAAAQISSDRQHIARLASVSSASAETLALQAIKAVTATAKDGAAGLSRIMAITNAAGVKAPYSELLQDPAVALIVERPRTEWAHLFKPHAKGCAIPPEGWQCSRARGHAGPCAASLEPVPATNQAGEVDATEIASRLLACVETGTFRQGRLSYHASDGKIWRPADARRAAVVKKLEKLP